MSELDDKMLDGIRKRRDELREWLDDDFRISDGDERLKMALVDLDRLLSRVAAPKVDDGIKAAAEEIENNLAWLEDRSAHQSAVGEIITIISRHLLSRVAAPKVDLIAKVREMRDKCFTDYEHYAISGAPTAGAAYKLDAYDEIIAALESVGAPIEDKGENFVNLEIDPD